MRFTETLWSSITGIYQAIIQHPFNEELAQGTLSREKFAFYMQQDALYLADFARALATMAGRAPDEEAIIQFARFAEGVAVVERALHFTYFREFGIDAPTRQQSPSCFAYTNFLLATAACRSYEEGMAALLPCFWIYREVGSDIYRRAAPNNPYQKWIDTYAGQEFAEWVNRAIDLTDAIADQASEPQKARMRDAFVHSSRLEWMFWDSAYRLEQWMP
ncbi:thiaminase II [Roseiflexus sp.]|uniref:thiaminase II n=1 Tax=Roseiflexus sp. TaxID=2562120 RepID=UPI0021DDE145|nr:thiaminase II [Roseiflexus sp.]GIW00403.1 MAG: aminopyrimidine aminohydrolase [Roseiflexus sp.]